MPKKNIKWSKEESKLIRIIAPEKSRITRDVPWQHQIFWKIDGSNTISINEEEFFLFVGHESWWELNTPYGNELPTRYIFSCLVFMRLKTNEKVLMRADKTLRGMFKEHQPEHINRYFKKYKEKILDKQKIPNRSFCEEAKIAEADNWSFSKKTNAGWLGFFYAALQYEERWPDIQKRLTASKNKL